MLDDAKLEKILAKIKVLTQRTERRRNTPPPTPQKQGAVVAAKEKKKADKIAVKTLENILLLILNLAWIICCNRLYSPANQFICNINIINCP